MRIYKLRSRLYIQFHKLLFHVTLNQEGFFACHHTFFKNQIFTCGLRVPPCLPRLPVRPHPAHACTSAECKTQGGGWALLTTRFLTTFQVPCGAHTRVPCGHLPSWNHSLGCWIDPPWRDRPMSAEGNHGLTIYPVLGRYWGKGVQRRDLLDFNLSPLFKSKSYRWKLQRTLH